MHTVTFSANPPLDDATLNALFERSWARHAAREFSPILARSAAYFGAFADAQLVGFVNLITDAGAHAFVLDPTVDPNFRRRGIGLALVAHAVAAARRFGCEWVHVDYEPQLATFYARAGFRGTDAALLHFDREQPA